MLSFFLLCMVIGLLLQKHDTSVQPSIQIFPNFLYIFFEAYRIFSVYSSNFMFK
ncbi:hypothetical protein NC652_037919 [Populus alba x Populus x berolinensis]|nr:hypothetical protein NC652_037919 [Populus alba x Populus x berolinensis]